MRLTVPEPCLVILCGPAGSGKSTFAVRNFPETSVVSSDRCRAMIADDEAKQAEAQRIEKENAILIIYHDMIKYLLAC